MRTLQGHRGKIRGLAFSPDSRWLATVAGREKRISLWELPGGSRSQLPDEVDEIQALAWTPGADRVVFASGRYLCRWDPGAGTLEDRWLRGANHCHQVAVSPDGSRLAATCFNRRGDGDCFRVDLFHQANLPRKTWLPGDYGFPTCLAFSPEGRSLAVGGECKCVRLPWAARVCWWSGTWMDP